MKRYVIWIIILSLSLVFIGNERSTEVVNRALVHAVGIDMDDNGYTVTLQIFQSEGAGTDTQIDSSKSNIRVVSNTAKTFDEAMKLCENQLGNYLFIGHNQVIVLGNSTDFNDPKELFSYFINESDNFLGVDVVLAENTAKEILDIKIPIGTISTEYFKEVVKMYSDKGEAYPSDMVDFLNETMVPDTSAILPVISLKQEEPSSQDESSGQQGQSTEQQGGEQQGGEQQGGEQQGGEESQSSPPEENTLYSINSSAIISRGKIVGTISNEETKCISLMTDKTKYSTIDVSHDQNNISVKLNNRHCKTKIYTENGKIIYDVNLSLKGISNNVTYTTDDKKEISKQIETKLESQCSSIFNKTLKEYNSDIFNIYGLIKHYCPKLYLKYKDNFEVLKANTQLKINVDCIVK